MAIYPLQIFTRGNVIVGRDDDYKSSVLGQKFLGMPRGVYLGLTPSNTPPSTVLTLGTDPATGVSLVKVPSSSDHALVDVIFTAPVVIDFAAQAPSDFPIDVVVRATYADDPATPTSAEVIARSAGTLAWNEVRVCRVIGSATSMVIDTSVTFGVRTAPLAVDGVDFGFMPAGSIEQLEAAVDMVNEVVAARIGLDAIQYGSLSYRLAVDQSASAMASRLALKFTALRSNDYVVGAGESQINVSGSFSSINRSHNPRITLAGTGDETTAGVVAAPNDTVRNVCVIQSAVSGYRPVNDPIERLTVFGRLQGPEELIVRGVWTFTNASTTATADSDGRATEDLEVGDTIQGPDGLFYEVAAIVNDAEITLKAAYTGATTSSDNLIARRWLLNLKVMRGSSEEDASFAVPTTIRFFFPAFVPMDVSTPDWTFIGNSPLVREPLPEATTTVPGRVRLAAVGGRLGAVNIQNAGVPLAGGPFHTINFSAPNANVVEGSTPGEVVVEEIGPIGPQGPAGSTGAPGNPGPVGPGFSALNTFEASSELVVPSPYTNVPWSFTRDMGHNVRYVGGGLARYRSPGGHFNGSDIVNITDITTISATEARIEGNYEGDVRIIVFLNSAGD